MIFKEYMYYNYANSCVSDINIFEVFLRLINNQAGFILSMSYCRQITSIKKATLSDGLVSGTSCLFYYCFFMIFMVFTALPATTFMT